MLIAALLLSLACCNKDKKDRYQGLIPNVSVNFYIHPITEGLISGGWKVYPEYGYRGVLVYCLDQYTYIAYEMACPYDYQKETAIVEYDPATAQLVDSTCNSRYQILDGVPVGGPATVELKQYITEYSNLDGMLHIYNSF